MIMQKDLQTLLHQVQIDLKYLLKLAKKALTDYEDTNFVELMRTDEGEIKKLQDTSTYSELKKYFAKRTYDESGDYSVEPFRVDIQESLK